jgi:O-antigen ligase
MIALPRGALYRATVAAAMIRAQSPPTRAGTVPLGRSVVVHSDSYRYARWVLFMLLLVTIDVSDFTDRSGSPIRYVILFFPLIGAAGAILATKSLRVRRLSPPDRVLLVFFAYGLVGSLYGRVVLHEQSGAVPVFLPMLIAFSYLATTWQITEDEARHVTRSLAIIGLVYAVLNTLANLSAVGFIAPKTYRNSKVLYVAMGVVAAWVSKRRVVFTLLLVLSAIIFVSYRSGTNAVIVIVTLVAMFVTKPGGSPLRPYVAAAAAIAILVLAVINFTQTAGVASAYFSALDKKNNNNARIALYSNGFQRFLDSPIIGSGFTGDITETVVRRDGQGAPFHAPFHDDYIMTAAVGGAVGLLLLLLWIATTVVTTLRRYRGFLAAGEKERAGLLRVLFVTFNVMFAAALFNPELSAVGRGATAFGLYALMMMVGEPPPAQPVGRGRRTRDTPALTASGEDGRPRPPALPS